MSITKNPKNKRKYLLELLNKAHARMERNKEFNEKRGIHLYPQKAVENMLSVRRKLVALDKEVAKIELANFNTPLTTIKDKALESLVADWAIKEYWPFLSKRDECCLPVEIQRAKNLIGRNRFFNILKIKKPQKD